MFILIVVALFALLGCAIGIAFLLFPDQREHAAPGRPVLHRREYASKPRHNRR